MLILCGTLRAATTLGGGVNKKTGEVIQPRDDKFVRALAVSEAWNEGRVLLPMTAPWLADFMSIVLGFTGVNDAHDDDVDALAAAFDLANKPRPNLSDVPDLGGVSVSY